MGDWSLVTVPSLACVGAGARLARRLVAACPDLFLALSDLQSQQMGRNGGRFDRTDFRGGFTAASFQIAVTVTNRDAAAHDANIQANFYDVAGSDLGDDPASHLITAGNTNVTLAAHETRAVLINAKNVANETIISVGFRAICKGAPASVAYCGESDPFQ